MKRILIHRSSSNVDSKSVSPEIPKDIRLQKLKSSPCIKSTKPIILDFKIPNQESKDKQIKKRRHKKRAKKRKLKALAIP